MRLPKTTGSGIISSDSNSNSNYARLAMTIDGLGWLPTGLLHVDLVV